MKHTDRPYDRLIDTARVYKNSEVNIGNAIQESGVDRKELFISKYALVPLFASPDDKRKKQLKLFLQCTTGFLKLSKNHSGHCS